MIDQRIGGCPGPSSGGSIGGGGVDLWAHDQSGGRGSSRGSGNDNSGGGSDHDADFDDDSTDGYSGNALDPDCVFACRDPIDWGTIATDPAVVNAVVTLADLASFVPAAPTALMEPNGWMVVGLDANFYADAPAQVIQGTLLGYPASVRFTPVAYHWSYGDGTTADVRTPGASWAELGATEFSQTATSHIYDSAGGYTITLSVEYSAAYSFAGVGWRTVSGSLGLPADALTAVAGEAKTVLVDHNCTLDPSGPGC